MSPKKPLRGFLPLDAKKKGTRKKTKLSEEERAIYKTLTSTQVPILKLENVPFSDVLNFIRDILQRKGASVNITPLLGAFDSKLYQQKMSQCVSLYLQNVSIADILTLACLQANLEYTIIPQGVVIRIPKDGSAGSSIPVDEPMAKADNDRIQVIHKALENTRIPTLVMENMPLAGLLEYLHGTLQRNGSEVNFISVPSSTKEHTQITSQTVTLHLKNVSVNDVLTLVGKQLGIKYTILPQGVVISSAGNTP